MSKKLQAAVIGLGVGEQHLIGYLKNPKVEISGICDTDEKKLNMIGKKYSISKKFKSWKELFKEKLDLISICSYDNFHCEQTCNALENGIHCMVEKPIALTKKESEKILKAQQKYNCILTSNLILRESPRFKKLKAKIMSGQMGDIISTEADYLHNILWKITTGWRGKLDYYNTVFGGGVHLIDLVRWLIEKEIIEVYCMSNKIQTKKSNYKFDDFFCSLLKFENDIIFKSTTNFGPIRNKFHLLNVYGTKQTFINDLPNGYYFNSHGDNVKPNVDKTLYKSTMNKHALIDNFINCVNNKEKINVSMQDVFRVMDICFAISESAKNNKIVKVNYLI